MNAAAERDDGGPAFPTDSEHQPSATTWHFAGMSLRDYFAAKAMQGLLSNQIMLNSIVTKGRAEGLTANEALASASYGAADSMLLARTE